MTNSYWHHWKNHQSFQPTCATTTRTAAKQCVNISITNQVQRGSSQAKQSKHPWKQFWMLPLLVSSLPGYLLWKLLPAQTYLPPFCVQRSSLPQQQGMVVICFQTRGRIIQLFVFTSSCLPKPISHRSWLSSVRKSSLTQYIDSVLICSAQQVE